MAKAILEMEMPENCIKCNLSAVITINGMNTWVCMAQKVKLCIECEIATETKNKNCPLKKQEDSFTWF